MQRVKLIDVARAAGVHPGTASRALNSGTGGRVSAETTRRVVQAAKKLGYVPNNFARGLRTARSFVIGMIVPDVTNSLFPPMVRGAEQVLSQVGYTLVVTDTDNDAATERSQIERLLARGTDGFLIATARWDDPLVESLADSEVPAVLVNRNTGTHRLPYVGCDERTGISMAVDHLVALGHRRIVHLAARRTPPPAVSERPPSGTRSARTACSSVPTRSGSVSRTVSKPVVRRRLGCSPRARTSLRSWRGTI